MKSFIFCITILFALAACNQKPDAATVSEKYQAPKHVQRFGMVTGLKPEKAAYYKQLHAAAWPAVQEKITSCHIQNYSIYLKEVEGKLLLFSYFEYTGENFDMDMKKMAEDSMTQKWWRETDPCQQPLPDAAAKKQIWSNMEEVFHQQ